jgi:hypothetical protein
VVNRYTDDRILIKGMRGAEVDLSFAHTNEEVVVGVVDSMGNLFVHKVTEDSSGLASERVVEVLSEVVVGDYDAEAVLGSLSTRTCDGGGAWHKRCQADPRVTVRGVESVPGPLVPGNAEHGLIKIQDIGGDVASSWMLPSLQMGQQWPQPVGMARSSSSKYISIMRRVLLWVFTIGVLFLDGYSSHQPDGSVLEVFWHWL